MSMICVFEKSISLNTEKIVEKYMNDKDRQFGGMLDVSPYSTHEKRYMQI